MASALAVCSCGHTRGLHGGVEPWLCSLANCSCSGFWLAERESMAAEARASLASRGLLSAPVPVLEKPTTPVPAEHGGGDLPVAVRPAESTPGVAVPPCVLCGRPVDNGSPEEICNAHGGDEVREFRLHGEGGRGRKAARPAPEPEVRRCSVREPGAAYEGRVLESCDTVIGVDVLCSACGGGEPVAPERATKCYQHCQSIDHFGAPLTMSTQVARWGIVLRARGLAFQGEVRELESERLGARVVRVLPKTFGGTDAEKVVGEMLTFVDGLRNRLPYESPTVTPLPAALRGPRFGDRGDETCTETDAFDPLEWTGITPHAMAAALPAMLVGSRLPLDARRALGRQLEAFALNLNHAWGELEEADERVGFSDAVRRARALADAAVCAAISLMAGGVR